MDATLPSDNATPGSVDVAFNRGPQPPVPAPAPAPPPAAPAPPRPTSSGLPLQPLATHPTVWEPSTARVALHVSLDACIVPDAEGRKARVDRAQVLVLDNFIGEEERAELLDFITEPGWDPQQPPPASKWRRATRDNTDAAPTWGLRGSWLRRLADTPLRAKLEVQSRLARLYPDYIIAHMPSDAIQMLQGPAGGQGQGRDQGQAEAAAAEVGDGAGDRDGYREGKAAEAAAPAALADDAAAGGGAGGGPSAMRHTREGGDERWPSAGDDGAAPRDGDGDGEDGGDGDDDYGGAGSRDGDDGEQLADEAPIVDCNQFVANAAMYGDSYSWHVDADPSTLPYPSPWTLKYGQYVNREPGRPLFVSLLLYLNREWERDWNAETLFLDVPTDCGLVVRPKAYRAVLLDQDVVHRLVPPSAAAGSRPRYSLVWKLVFLPRRPGAEVSLTRRRWSKPAPFGSAVLLDRIVADLAAGRPVGAAGAGLAAETAGAGAGRDVTAAMAVGKTGILAAGAGAEGEAGMAGEGADGPGAAVGQQMAVKGKRAARRKRKRAMAAAAGLDTGAGETAAAGGGTDGGVAEAAKAAVAPVAADEAGMAGEGADGPGAAAGQQMAVKSKRAARRKRKRAMAAAAGLDAGAGGTAAAGEINDGGVAGGGDGGGDSGGDSGGDGVAEDAGSCPASRDDGEQGGDLGCGVEAEGQSWEVLAEAPRAGGAVAATTGKRRRANKSRYTRKKLKREAAARAAEAAAQGRGGGARGGGGSCSRS